MVAVVQTFGAEESRLRIVLPRHTEVRIPPLIEVVLTMVAALVCSYLFLAVRW
jgi:hypothetical protein